MAKIFQNKPLVSVNHRYHLSCVGADPIQPRSKENTDWAFQRLRCIDLQLPFGSGHTKPLQRGTGLIRSNYPAANSWRTGSSSRWLQWDDPSVWPLLQAHMLTAVITLLPDIHANYSQLFSKTVKYTWVHRGLWKRVIKLRIQSNTLQHVIH